MAECQEETQENVSDEDKTKLCDSCSFRGIRNPAETYCSVCAEYLCASCVEIHRSFRATRAHELVQIFESSDASFRMKGPVTNVMVCDIHRSGNMAEYCVTHEKAICRLCKTTKHRKCDTKDLGEAAEERKNSVKHFIQDIKLLLADFDEINNSRQSDKRQLFETTTRMETNVKMIHEEIISWAEKLEREAVKEIEKTKEKVVSKIDSHIAVSEDMINQLVWVRTAFERTGGDGSVEAFVLKEKTEQQIQEGRELKHEIQREISPLTCNFCKSDKLSRLLSEISSFGTIETRETSLVDFTKNSKLTKKHDIAVKSGWVTGCVFMPNGHLVVCDETNKTVKVFATDFILKSYLKCVSRVWDIAVLSTDEVIVSRPYLACLDVLNVSGTVRIVKSISVGQKCWGVDIKKGNIYATCHLQDGTRGYIKVLTLDGVCMNTFPIDEGKPYYLAVNDTEDRIIVSTDTASKVLCFDVRGNAIFTNSDDQIKSSLGLFFDSHNNFMVCGRGSNNVNVVPKDGTKHKILLSSDDGLCEPYCLAYRSADKTLVVGQRATMSLTAFSVVI